MRQAKNKSPRRPVDLAQFTQCIDQLPHVRIDTGDLGGVSLLLIGPWLVTVNSVVINFMTAMRQCNGIEQQERSLGMVTEPSNHVILYQLLSVRLADTLTIIARQQEGLIVVEQVGRKIGMRVSLAVVAEEMIDTLSEWTATGIEKSHSPFAESCRRVSRRFRHFGNGDDIIG